MLYHCKKKGFL